MFGKSKLAKELTIFHHGVVNGQMGSSLESYGKYSNEPKGYQNFRFLGNNSAAAAAYEMYYGLEDVKPVRKKNSITPLK